MARRRHEPVLPGRLTVVVGVHVDKAGGHEQAARVDLFAGAAGDRANRGDQPVFDRQVGDTCRAAEPVMDSASADDQIVVGHFNLLVGLLRGALVRHRF